MGKPNPQTLDRSPRNEASSRRSARNLQETTVINHHHHTLKRKQIVLYDHDDDDDIDEDLNAEVNKLCQAVTVCIRHPVNVNFTQERTWYRIIKSLPDAQLTSSRFHKFCRHYKSTFGKFMESYSRVGIYAKEDVLPDNNAAAMELLNASPTAVAEIYSKFKSFATVSDHSDHLFSKYPEITQVSWTSRVRKEFENLKENLPEGIFVRAYEGRLDLLRAVIIGPKGTPYHDGLFFFDIYLSITYPRDPPDVRYHSYGFGINPHLFECGEVRFNLFSDFYQPDLSLWWHSEINMVEFLATIKDVVLNADPLLHQSVSSEFGPSVVTDWFSLLYNEDILIKSLKTMMHIINKPPKNFEGFVVGHFRSRVIDILTACRAYKEGLPVGGRVGDKDICCSIEFRKIVDSYIWPLACFFESKLRANKVDIFQGLFGPLPL